MARMLGKSACLVAVCACHKHHRPPVPWKKLTRRAARAKEKAILIRNKEYS